MDRTPIKERAHGRWKGILPALGVPSAFLNGKHQPCLLCGGKDRARFDDKGGNGTFICSKCGAGSGIDLLMKFHGWDFKQAVQEIEKVIGGCRASAPRQEQTDASKREAMNRLWKSGQAVTLDDPVGRYLNRRCGITEFPKCIRYVRRARYAESVGFPAMVSMIAGPDGKPASLHRTFLAPEGDKAAVESPRRMMPGTVAKGAAIRLAEHGDSLGIAEGIETAFSASALFGIPVWAVVNSELMKSWEVPAGVSRVVIFGDNDPGFAGQAAAFGLARRLAAPGLVINIEIPPVSGDDWNDVHARSLAPAMKGAA